MIFTILFALMVCMLAYQTGLNTIYLVLLAISWRQIRRHMREEPATGPSDVFSSPFTPSVTLVVAAYNEEVTIVESLRGFLSLRYPDLQIVVVNDGSTDRTFELLREAFGLQRTYRVDPKMVPCTPIRGIWASRRHHNLLVVDKENGGRADAMNAALNFADRDLICQSDADSILEDDALLRMVAPFLREPDTVVGTGGIIRLVNGCTVDGGRVTKVGLARNWWVRFQVVEYLRAFLIGRLGWSKLNATLLVSGAFGMWRRDMLVEAGGYSVETLGEDAELTMRMHRLLRRKEGNYKIVFVPDPVCWTEAPSSLRVLARQRRRWSRGMGECLWLNRELFLNRHHGACGLLAFPYYAVYEFSGALVEFLGWIAFPILLLAGFLEPLMILLFFLLAIVYGAVLASSAVLLEQFTYRYYERWSDMFVMVLFAVLENFGYHQLHVWWRVQGIWDLATRRSQHWGNMQRVGFEHAG